MIQYMYILLNDYHSKIINTYIISHSYKDFLRTFKIYSQ